MEINDCCDDCDYWDHIEAQIDNYIEDQIKEAKLINIAKKNSESKLLILKALSGNNKTERENVELEDEVYRVDNNQVIAL